MNPLTRRATRDPKADKRTDLLICFASGIVFASLMMAFLLKSTA
jgi:hypothetical protein